jgi:hypothetical protein
VNAPVLVDRTTARADDPFAAAYTVTRSAGRNPVAWRASGFFAEIARRGVDDVDPKASPVRTDAATSAAEVAASLMPLMMPPIRKTCT